MRVTVGSTWLNIAEDDDVHGGERGKRCVVTYCNDHPDLNGDGSISLLYEDGTIYEGKVRRFIPGYTHTLVSSPYRVETLSEKIKRLTQQITDNYEREAGSLTDREKDLMAKSFLLGFMKGYLHQASE